MHVREGKKEGTGKSDKMRFSLTAKAHSVGRVL